MTIQVTMKQPAFGPGGALYAVGTTQTVADDVGYAWIQAGIATDAAGERVEPLTELPGSLVPAVVSLVSRAGIVASDTGSTWTGAPSLLSFSAVLDSGTSTTVLLEVRDAAGTVATAATIVADTLTQTLRQALLLRQQSEYRFRRSSGTGSVTITV